MGICNYTRTKSLSYSHSDNSKIYKVNSFHYQTDKFLCKIQSKTLGYGTGFLCKIPFLNKDNITNFLPILIINSNIIENDDIAIGKSILIYLGNEKYSLEIDNSRKIYINDKYNIIIIEINEKDKLKINSFLEIDSNIYKDKLNEIFIGKSIYLFYFQNGKDLKYSSGSMKNIDNNNFTFEHSCLCDIGSLGAPLMLLSNKKLVGMHKGINEVNYNRIGIFLKEPIEEFCKLYKSKASNNLNYIRKNTLNKNKEINKNSNNNEYKKNNSINNKSPKKNSNHEYRENETKINLIFKLINGKELNLEVKDNIEFNNAIELLYSKYTWLKNLKIIDFINNKKQITKNKTVTENGLNNNSIIIIVEKK